ncbi:MAG: hypothetical protein U0794_10690 [Isosphaeraceae bacterium]
MEARTSPTLANFNLSMNGDSSINPFVGYTAWSSVSNAWLCPADPDNMNGLRPSNTADGNGGQYPIQGTRPKTATNTFATVVPVANYAGSFGDNNAITGLTAGAAPAPQSPCTFVPTAGAVGLVTPASGAPPTPAT